MSTGPTATVQAPAPATRIPPVASTSAGSVGLVPWAVAVAAHGAFLAAATVVVVMPGGRVDRKPLPPLIIHPSNERETPLRFEKPVVPPAPRERESVDVPELLPPEDPTPRLPDPERPPVVVSAEPLPEEPLPAEALTMRIAPAPSREPTPAIEAPPDAPADAFTGPQPAQPIRIDYPAQARRRGLAGVVEVEISVDETGAVSTLRVAVSSGHPILDEAALKGLAGIHFTPALRNGAPVPHTFRQPVRFVLREAP